MLLADINMVLEKYKRLNFTGHIRFGIEKSQLVTLTINSRLEKSVNENDEFDKKLTELCQYPNFYGSIEFDLILGKVQSLNYCMSMNGQVLRYELEGY